MEGQNEEANMKWKATLVRCGWLRLRTCRPVKQLPHIAGRRSIGRLLGLNKQATTLKSADVQGSHKTHSPSSIKILKVTVMLGVLECHLQVFLHLRDFLKIIRHLKTLHVWEQKLQKRSQQRKINYRPWTIRASLWYLLKLRSFFPEGPGESRNEGFPSRQKVTSVK